MEWRKGNTVSSSDWIEAMEKVWRSPTAQHRIRLNRGDIGFGQEPIMAWHEQGNGKRPSFLFKLKLTANVKKPLPTSHGTIGSKFASFLKQAYQRLEQWLSQTAPQLTLTMGKSPPWLLFNPTQATSSAIT